MSNKQRTKIEEVIDAQDDHEEEGVLDEENLSTTIMDLSLSLQTRIKALDLFYKNNGMNETIELISRMTSMYEMSGIHTLRKYLFAVCQESSLDPFLRTFPAKALYAINHQDDLAHEAIVLVYPSMGDDVATTYRIDFLLLLLDSEKYKMECRDHLFSILSNKKLTSSYRYKIILNIEDRKNKDNNDRVMWMIKECCLFFLQDDNDSRERILASQNALQNCDLQEEERGIVEQTLLTIASDEDEDYNIRADATDTLLHFASDGSDVKKQAEEIIMELGRKGGVVRNIYDNAQNVHLSEIEKSVEKAIEFLHAFDIITINGREIDIDYIEKEILKGTKKKDKERVKIALQRIRMDRRLYGKFNYRLSTIILRLWTFIVNSDYQEEITKRLREELIDMANTCSSGFVGRLVNTISGFDDFTPIKISWKDQIIANFTGRLNAKIRNMDNLRLRDRILSQMTLETDNHRERRHFLKFLRENYPSIREEMYEEFKEYITDDEFEISFRAALSTYETGKFL